jgi:hypothetical protein
MKQCGRGPNDRGSDRRGACPTPNATRANGVNGGINGGRVCWVIAGTLCEGHPMGTYAAKLPTCMNCEVFQLVLKEEPHGTKVDERLLRRLT